jgi:hypothetical protein
MAAKTDRQCAIALVREEVQEVFVPTPGRMIRAVNEKHWHLVGFAARPLVDHLEHYPASSRGDLWTLIESSGLAA